MTPLDRVVGWTVALAAGTGIVLASHVPIATHAADRAVLRLAWSARPERVEVCRTLSQEELAGVPAHMRQSVVCEGTSAAYRLEVRREGSIIAEQPVRGGGMRRDRPLYVFRDLPQPAGEASIVVRFERVDPPADADAATTAETRLSSGLPRSLLFERRLTFRPGEVILVTYDPVRRELTTVQ